MSDTYEVRPNVDAPTMLARVRHSTFDEGRVQLNIDAGRHWIEHGAGELYAFDAERWDHSIVVAVSRTGRSVRVFVDGVEVTTRKLSADERRERKRQLAASSSTSKKARRVTKRLSASRVKRPEQ